MSGSPTFARDMFLLAQILPRTDSPKANAMIYDVVIEEMGQPGIGYDPVALFHAGQAGYRAVAPKLREVEARGVAALKAEGWI